MKKFYTLLAAAAVTFGAPAVAQKAVPVGKASANKVFTEKTFQLESIKLKSPVTGLQDVVRSTKGGITLGTPIDKIPGYYAENEYSIASNGQGGVVGWQGPIQNLISLGDAENTLDVFGFWIGADKSGNFFSHVTGSYDQSKSTLSFPAGTLVANVQLEEDGSNADIYMYILNLETGKYETGDIVFSYSAAAHGFSYEATDNGTQYTTCLFFTTDKDAAGQTSNMRGFDFLVDCSLNLFNGAMDFTIKAQDEGEDDTEIGDYIYAETFDNSLLVYNMLGNGYNNVVEFVVDKAASTATLIDQYMQLPTQTGSRIYYFISADGQSMTVPFAGTTTTVGTGADQMTMTTLENDGFFFLSQDYYGYETSACKIQLLDMALFAPTAIKNVSADFDENAPVEYFNLQGVRVENPANGLYIKRQGNKVAKVIL